MVVPGLDEETWVRDLDRVHDLIRRASDKAFTNPMINNKASDLLLDAAAKIEQARRYGVEATETAKALKSEKKAA